MSNESTNRVMSPSVAERLARHPKWEWAKGMMVETEAWHGPIVEVFDSPDVACQSVTRMLDLGVDRDIACVEASWATPDLEHWSIKGYLLHTIREMAPDYDVAVVNHEGVWKLTFQLHGRLINGFLGMTEGEVLAKTWITMKNRRFAGGVSL